ncbi:integrase catalytic domain-containing protein [Trichonephila clavata]|uniref:Integrase catalytic domain-containing protein n=1 Tax=Trichonephila clavata TaxID=2740835 RepID=A0A8X6I1U7_TRICU|nr:integrase catalytic domain-containing protein [Trichonephila clavata]
MEFETLQLELKQLLQRGGMTLHKWYTDLSPTTVQEEFPLVRYSEEIQVKTLGMIWNSISVISVVLHGFADASSKAYGAVIYMQTVSITDESNYQLLCSKSRVAPIELVPISRLELCACLLLSKLTRRVISAVKMQIESMQLCSDSTIALA